ncbi:MAG: hypothetical protein AAF677_10715 [Pseudomonadota bacterium]
MRRNKFWSDLSMAVVAAIIVVSAGMGLWASAALPSGVMVATVPQVSSLP